MNHIYRLVWNEFTRAWVAVAEIARGRGKRSRGTVGQQPVPRCAARQMLQILAASISLIGAPSYALDINALPTGGRVSAGTASINQSANTLTVQQASQKAALDWQSFNIGAKASVTFNQPNSSAIALNRIGGNSGSEIFGKLNANGQVFLLNPNGMLFARGSEVNVGGLLATTLNLSNSDFMAGNYRFSSSGNASIRNEGILTASGSVALVGSSLQNAGQIIATTATLAAGNSVAIDLTGDGLIRARVENPALRANIENSGNIHAATVTLTAGQSRDMLDSLVNNTGVIRATGLAKAGGEIVLEGGGRVLNAGKLDASSADGKGGTVQMLGQQVGITGNAMIDVSGATGGGAILIGGDYQGKNPNVSNARATWVGADTVLNADATQTGNGGKIIVWSDDATRAYGRISARGGAQGGDGGFIETSGHWLSVAGIRVDAGAAKGKAGNWLLDPYDITIQDGGSTTGNSFTLSWTAPGDDSAVANTDIENALNSGNNVTLYTGGASVGVQAGNITVAAAISKTGGGDATLHLKADNAVIVNSGISIGATSNKLHVVLNADADNSGAGSIQVGAGSSILTNGGNLVMGGGACTLTGCTGAATGYDGEISRAGISLGEDNSSPTTLDTSATAGAGGNAWINGKGLDGTSGATGIYAHNILIKTGGGNITLTGTGGNGTGWDNNGIDIYAATLDSRKGNYDVGAGSFAATGMGGAVTLTGAGGEGVDGQYGVTLNSTNIKTGGGALTVTGASQGTGEGNEGIYIYGSILDTRMGDYAADSSFTAAGTGGAIALSGAGGQGTNYNWGVDLSDTTLITGGGSLTVTGTSGGTEQENYGIYAYTTGFDTRQGDYAADGSFTATGIGGTASLTGISGNGTYYNSGVYLDEYTNIKTGGAPLTISGTGQGSEDWNIGIDTYSAILDTRQGDYASDGSFTWTNTGGNIQLTGFGGNGTSYNTGVYLGADSGIKTGGGELLITGTGKGWGNDNSGINVYLVHTSLDTRQGDYVYDSGTGITSFANQTGVGGALSLAGVGSKTGTDNNSGVILSATLLATDGGTLTVTGTGGGSGSSNYGIYTTEATLDSGSGAMELTGKGAGAEGLYFYSFTVIGGANQSGDITLIADSNGADSFATAFYASDPAPIIQSSGTLTLRPLNDASTIGIAGGSGDFNLGSDDLLTFSSSFSNIVVGKPTGTGRITLGGNWNVNGDPTNLTLQNAGIGSDGIDLNGNLSVPGQLTLNTTGVTTQNPSTSITANSMELLGAGGYYLLTGNNLVGTLTGDTGGVVYQQTGGDLTIGNAELKVSDFAVIAMPEYPGFTVINDYNITGGVLQLVNGAEKYVAPNVNYWTGQGDEVSWSSAGNWSSNAVPTSSSIVRIVTSPTVTLNGAGAAASLVSTADMVIDAGGALTLSGNAHFLRNLALIGADSALTLNTAGIIDTLDLAAGSVSGSGDLAVTRNYTNAAGTLGSGFRDLSLALFPESGEFILGTPLTATRNLTLRAGSNVQVSQTFSGVPITAAGLELLGGKFVLLGTDNNFSTLAANARVVILSNNHDFSIGAVNGTVGITVATAAPDIPALAINSTGTVSQSAPIVADGLELGGEGNYTLTDSNNRINWLQGSVGSLDFLNNGSFAVSGKSEPLTITGNATLYAKDGDLIVQQSAILKRGAANATLHLKADNALIVDGSIGLDCDAGGKINVILNSDADSSGAGNVQAHWDIATNGGNLVMGGGTCTTDTWTCTGAATGYANTNGLREGVVLGYDTGEGWSGITLDTSGGNIWMKAKGLDGVSYATGILAASSEITTGSGNITLAGVGGNGTYDNIGIMLDATNITTNGGAITFTGTGNLSVENHGISTHYATLDSGSGAMTLTGTGANGAAGIHFGSGTTVGGIGQTGSITLISDNTIHAYDDWAVASPLIQGSGTLTIQPIHDATSIGLSGGNGELNLDLATLAAIQPGFTNIVFGKTTGTGKITLGEGGLDGGAGATNFILQNAGTGSAGIELLGSIITDGSITLNTGGAISQTSGALTSGTIALTAGSGIGTSGTKLALVTNGISANTATGGIYLLNTPSDTVTLSGLSTGSASSLFYSQDGQDLNITGNLTSAGGGIVIDPPIGLTMSPGTTIASSGGSIELQASGNIVLAGVNAGSGSVGVTTNGGTITSATPGVNNVTAGSLNLAANGDIALRYTTLTAPTATSASGTVALTNATPPPPPPTGGGGTTTAPTTTTTTPAVVVTAPPAVVTTTPPPVVVVTTPPPPTVVVITPMATAIPTVTNTIAAMIQAATTTLTSSVPTSIAPTGTLTTASFGTSARTPKTTALTSAADPATTTTASDSSTENGSGTSDKKKTTAKPVITTVAIANTTVQKLAGEMVQPLHSSGHKLVCR